MAQQLKTDWILFPTIVAMVSFGLVMVYSASSVMAQLKFGSSWHFFVPAARLVAVAFVVADAAEAHGLPPAAESHGGVSGHGHRADPAADRVLSSMAAHHRWLRLGPVRHPAFGIGQAGADHLSGLLRRRCARAPSTTGTRCCRPRWPSGLVTVGVVVADLGTAVVLIATAAVVFFVAGLERRYCAIALRGRGAGRGLRWWPPSPTAWRASCITVDPDYTMHRPHRFAAAGCKAYLQSIADLARHQLSGRAVEDRGGHRRPAGPGTDAGQTEAAVSAGSAHRFYLRHGRRGTGPDRVRWACWPDSS